MRAGGKWTGEDVREEATRTEISPVTAHFDRADDAPVLDHKEVRNVPVRFSLRGLPEGHMCHVYPNLRRRLWVRRTSRTGLVDTAQYTYYEELSEALEAAVQWSKRVQRELAMRGETGLQPATGNRD